MTQVQVGGDAKAFYNTGTYAVPVWVEIKAIGDVTIPDLNVSLAEIKVRMTKWNLNLPANFTAAVEFSYLWGADTAVFDYLRGAFFDRTITDIAIMDGAMVSGAEGLRAHWMIENFPINQNLEEAMMIDTVRLAPAWFEDGGTLREPVWYIVP